MSVALPGMSVSLAGIMATLPGKGLPPCDTCEQFKHLIHSLYQVALSEVAQSLCHLTGAISPISDRDFQKEKHANVLWRSVFAEVCNGRDQNVPG